MSHTIAYTAGASREQIYGELLPQIEGLVRDCEEIANLANVAAVLRAAFGFPWVGFYRTTAPNLLTVGPYQGNVPCIEIPFGRGVCGVAAREQSTLIVADVEQFPDYIACEDGVRSEIVVPGVFEGRTRFVLDIDSNHPDDFGEVDRHYLERIVAMIVAELGG